MGRKQQHTPFEKVNEVQDFVLAQLEDAKKRLAKIEKELVTRGRTQQKELESLIERVRSGRELRAFEKKGVEMRKMVEKRVTGTASDVKKAIDDLQGQVLTTLGIATQSEIEQISKELSKLSKKVDALRKPAPAAQA